MTRFRKMAIAFGLMLFTASPSMAGNCLQKKSHQCCVCQQKTCKLNVDTVEVDEPCFDVECADVCIPPVRFWWQDCPPKRCAKVRTVNKLVVEKQKKTVCVYDWEVVTICRACYRHVHRLRCEELGLGYDATPEQVGLPVPVEETAGESGLVSVAVADVSSLPLDGRADVQDEGLIVSEAIESRAVDLVPPVRVGVLPVSTDSETR